MGREAHVLKITKNAPKEDAYGLACSCGKWEGWGKYDDAPTIMSNGELHLQRRKEASGK